MADRLRDLGWESVMAGWYVALAAIFLPIAGGIVTSPGQMVDAWWLWAAAYTVLFGACLIVIGHSLMLLVNTCCWLVRRFLAWRHAHVWRRTIR